MTSPKLKPFQPHPDGRLVPVEEVPSLDASELAWSGIIERGADGDMWPFDNLAEESEYHASRNPHQVKLELETLHRREDWPDRIYLAATFKVSRPDWPDRQSTDDWRDFNLVSTTPHFGGKRWWFECPGCQKLRARVYLIPCQYSLCRVCLNLTYETKQLHNRASRHGRGWRTLSHYLHIAFEEDARQERRNLRRRIRRSGELFTS